MACTRAVVSSDKGRNELRLVMGVLAGLFWSALTCAKERPLGSVWAGVLTGAVTRGRKSPRNLEKNVLAAGTCQYAGAVNNVIIPAESRMFLAVREMLFIIGSYCMRKRQGRYERREALLVL